MSKRNPRFRVRVFSFQGRFRQRPALRDSATPPETNNQNAWRPRGTACCGDREGKIIRRRMYNSRRVLSPPPAVVFSGQPESAMPIAIPPSGKLLMMPARARWATQEAWA